MALLCEVFVDLFDDQHRTQTLSFFVPPPASLGTGVDLPTQAHILNFINALVGPTNLSQARVLQYGVRVIQTDVTGVATPGDGSIALTNAFKARSGVGLVGRADPFGDLEGIEMRIPAANQSTSIFNPADRNAVNTSSSIWRAVATALQTLGYQDSHGTALTGGAVLEVATFFDGKRAPMRPR
jgi:hypothetical protein